MSFDARDLMVPLVPDNERPGLFACNVCNSTANQPKPNCPPPSKPCPAPSKPPKGPKKRAELEALDLALLRNQLREMRQIQ